MDFQCYYPNCPRSYNSKYNLKRHINTNHLHLKSYPCDQCEKTFASKKNLLKHTATHSEIVFEHVPVIVKTRKEDGKVKSYDLTPLQLSRLYKEVVAPIMVNPIISKQSLPSLPPVDLCRQSLQGEAKVPLLPVLLNYVKRN
jgi:uncharacterized Zn-finger protein